MSVGAIGATAYCGCSGKRSIVARPLDPPLRPGDCLKAMAAMGNPPHSVRPGSWQVCADPRPSRPRVATRSARSERHFQALAVVPIDPGVIARLGPVVAEAGEAAPDIGNVVNLGESRSGQVRPTGMLGLALAETLFGMIDAGSDAKRRRWLDRRSDYGRHLV